jgi:DNA-binding NtrC family response regulator
MSRNLINQFPADPILLVDDDRMSLESIEFLLKSNEIDHLFPCDDPRRVLDILEDRRVELILLDLVMPHVSGEDLLRDISERHPEIPVIVITGVRELETAIESMRVGAYDYLAKPVEENRMIYAIRRAVEFRQMREELACLQSHLHGPKDGPLEFPEAFEGIVAGSAAMMTVFHTTEAVARSTMPILITGETGVGKSLLAESVHKCSGRPGRFVAVSISGVDDAVFSDTLFGHVKGAFTGADGPRAGLIQKAEGGTLFLDEIGDLSPESQVKLLKLIQDGEYFPLGADTSRRADIRIVAATNRDLSERVREGRFRKDLFYRLHIHNLHLPPLRDRPEDIPLLLDHYVRKCSEELNRPKPSVSCNVITYLRNYPFPGNVRELQALVYDICAQSKEKTLKVDKFYDKLRRAAENGMGAEVCLLEGNPFSNLHSLPTWEQAYMMLIDESLRRTSGNKAMAARLLNITRQTLTKQAEKAAKKMGKKNGNNIDPD